jgi:hypothetical protein
MSLAVQASNVSNDLHTASEECLLVNHKIIRQLNNLALMELDPSVNGPAKTVNEALSTDTVPERKEHKKSVDYMRRVARLTEAILGKVYSMYPVRNAFEHVPFGINKHGIIVATTKYHLHSVESDILLHIAGVGYLVLAPSELNEFEKIIRGLVDSCKCCRTHYPGGTTKKNFGKLTLCSHKEKVGALYNLLLGLHHKDGCEVWDGAQKRQQSNYKTFPSKKKIKESHESKTNGKSTKKRKQDARNTPDDERSADNDEEDDANDKLLANAFLYRKDLMFGSDH